MEENYLKSSLKESDALKTALDEYAIVAITDPQGKITYVNDKFCAISQYTRAELMGQDHRMVNSGFHSKEFMGNLWATIGQGKVWKGEIKNKAKDGSLYWVDTTIVPSLDEEGKTRHYIAIRADITERKLRQDRTAWLASFPQRNPNPVFEIDVASGVIHYANPTALRLFPEIKNLGLRHALLAGLKEVEKLLLDGETDVVRREISAGESFFDQTISLIPAARLLRVYSTDITGRKLGEIAADRLASIVKYSDDAIISKNLGGIITSWNKGAENIFGYTAEDMVGTSIRRLIPADRREEENHILGQIKRGETVEHFETRRLTKDGRLIDVSVTASPIKDGHGSIVGVSKVARDITERKLAEKALEDSMRFAQSAIDVCVLDETGKIIATNEAWRKLSHLDQLEIGSAQLDDNYLEICDAAARQGNIDATSFAAGIREVIARKRTEFTMEYACHAPAEDRWFVGRVTRFPGTGVVRVVVAHEKVSERKLAEKAHRTGDARYRALFDYAPDGILISTQDAVYLDANASMCRMLGYTREEMIGKHGSDIVVEAEVKNIAPAVEAIVANTFYNQEWHFRRKDGSVFAAEVMATMTPDGNVMGVIRDITQRKKAETELLWKTAFLEAQVTSSADGILVVDGEQKRILQNERLMQLFQVPKEIADDADHAQFLEHASMQVKNPEAYLERIKHLYGHRDEIGRDEIELNNGRVLERYSSPVRDRAGKYYGRIWVFHDITERKLAEQALKESMRFAQSTIDALSAHICVLDEAGKILATNEAWREFAHLSQSPSGPAQTDQNYLTVCDAAALRGSEDSRTFAAGIREVAAGKRSDFTMEYACHSASEKRWFVGRVTCFPWNGAMRAVVAHENVTERKKAENELVGKTAFLEAQVASSADGIFVVDGEQKRILQNERLMQLFQVPQEIADDADQAKLLNHFAAQVKNPDGYLERVKHLYEHREEIGRDEIELRNGMVLERYSSPVRDRAGKYYGRIVLFHDTTERRKLETQIRQAQKMEGIGQLAGGVAHDFNNILAVIQLQSSLLKFTGGLTLEQKKYVDEIGLTVESAAALTRQLLLFSRREVFQPHDLDLNESIANTIKMLRRVLGENVEIQLKMPSQPMFIHADAGMMDQVLLNLVVNARDAMPLGGQLIIETSGAEFDELAAAQSDQARPGPFVCLSVSDSGCGIAAEVIPQIFEPFFTTKDVGKGTGLGLATVFGIVQQHQGWICVDSKVNRGTTFRVYLPRVAKNGNPKLIQPVAAEMRGGTETILIAEDDPKLRESVRKALFHLGYRILEASTGVKALEVWKQNRAEIRLLLTDLVMPDGMTGKDLADRVLQEDPKMKIIYMSGYSAQVMSEDFPLKEGVNFLAKPFRAVKLMKTVRDCLDRV